MQHLRAIFVTCLAMISITFMVAGPAMAGYKMFVFVPQAELSWERLFRKRPFFF